jgi:uncharacterized membrane protein YhhN
MQGEDADVQDFLILPVWVCLAAVAALLLAERQGRAHWAWALKPLAAAAFLWAALSWGALGSDYGRWVLIGLVLCAIGDVLLIPKGKSRWFLAGLGAFLLGHVAYAVAFATLPLAWSAALVAAALMGALAWLVLKWLLPFAPRPLRAPVLAYIGVISVMTVMATAAVGGGAHGVLLLGAAGFAVSDLAVARNRFIAPGFVNRVWGLPLYFASQLLIAFTVVTEAALP